MVSFPNNPPPEPGFQQVQLSVRNVVAQTEQSFNLHRKQHAYGSSKWVGSLTLPTMLQSNAREWKAWLTSMRGQRGSFKISDPSYFGPNGNVSQNGTVASVGTSSNFYVVGEGFGSSVSPLFKAGDQIEINDRLKIIIDDVDSTSNGKALIPLAPRVRDTQIVGNTINVTNPKGEFRLEENVVQWDEETITTRLNFPIVEVT